jgi:hypothetical protein
MFIILKKECEHTHEVATADTREAAEKLRDSLTKQWGGDYVVEEKEGGSEDVNN